MRLPNEDNIRNKLILDLRALWLFQTQEFLERVGLMSASKAKACAPLVAVV